MHGLLHSRLEKILNFEALLHESSQKAWKSKNCDCNVIAFPLISIVRCSSKFYRHKQFKEHLKKYKSIMLEIKKGNN